MSLFEGHRSQRYLCFLEECIEFMPRYGADPTLENDGSFQEADD